MTCTPANMVNWKGGAVSGFLGVMAASCAILARFSSSKVNVSSLVSLSTLC